MIRPSRGSEVFPCRCAYCRRTNRFAKKFFSNVKRFCSKVLSEFVSKTETHKARRLNRDRLPKVKGRAAEIVFLQFLPRVRHVQNVGNQPEPAKRKTKLPTDSNIPINRILRAVTALRASAH